MGKSIVGALDLDEGSEGHSAENTTTVWFERLTRFGYIAKGFVYFVLGLLAADAAFTIRRAPDTENALYSIVTQRFGLLMLTLVIIGLSGYVLWRFVMAVLDPERKGRSLVGIGQRLGYAISGLTYVGIAYTALEIVLHGRSGSQPTDWTEWVLTQPFGDWILGAVGLGLIGVGLEHVHRGLTAGFLHYCDFTRLRRPLDEWATQAGRYGLAARGIIYGIIGGLLVQAAVEFDPNNVEGLGSALRWLENQPFGPYVLAAVAVGLMAYGIFAVAEGYARQIIRD